jgi:hypothetical protein
MLQQSLALLHLHWMRLPLGLEVVFFRRRPPLEAMSLL